MSDKYFVDLPALLGGDKRTRVIRPPGTEDWPFCMGGQIDNDDHRRI